MLVNIGLHLTQRSGETLSHGFIKARLFSCPSGSHKEAVALDVIIHI
jgi:hypothetical protein